MDRTVVPGGTPDEPWSGIFPFDEPYPQQKEASREAAQTFSEGGFMIYEGACGSGKTLGSLSAALDRVRDNKSQFERIVAVTSVKQQMRAFEDDIEAINDSLRERGRNDVVDAMSITGKADLCSYVDADAIESGNIYGACDRMRRTVKNALNGASQNDKVGRLNGMIGDAEHQTELTDANSPEPTTLSAEGWTSTYQRSVPTRNDSDAEYCPFYAQSRLDSIEHEDAGLPVNGLVRSSELLRKGSDVGICPHIAMRDMLSKAEVVIGNYYHIFDHQTVNSLTSPLIDENTIVIVDEAHMLVPRVRDLLGADLSVDRIEDAIDELENRILNFVAPEKVEDGGTADTDVGRVLNRELSGEGIDVEDVTEIHAFLTSVRGWLINETTRRVAEDGGLYGSHPDVPDEKEFDLREPEKVEVDSFNEWVADQNHRQAAEKVAEITAAIASALRRTGDEVESFNVTETEVDGVGYALSGLANGDNETYFRQIILDKRRGPDDEQETEWAKHYTTRLRLNNCIPAGEIANRLDDFGAGMLMSATLSPLSIYREEVGLGLLEDEGRPVNELVHGLAFPEDNRASIAVDVTKFTSQNRGGYDQQNPPGTARFNDTRLKYANLISIVAKTTPGNVLVGMPSYAEGEWAAQALREDPTVDKEVLVDESSSDAETEELKQEFFDGDGKVLITSLRGTLTEGVDYDGERLSAAIVCGVPIRGLGGSLPDAIQNAYDQHFVNKKGFNTAFTVPAVRKARQALGRVIRGEDEVGTRVLADERWTNAYKWDSAAKYQPETERDDFLTLAPDEVESGLELFWNRHSEHDQD
ncbi:ATP-dependent DNA helicase [Halorubrum pallidum]|uniref:ATP-dependent DNA helicase n=1 Tax=Halorubrum pallidum TaxID=1526114 RepID=A0ABD5T3I1_9EURY